MKLKLKIQRRWPGLENLAPPHPCQPSWKRYPAPILELHLPWGPDEPGNWHPRRWLLSLTRGDRSWPCYQLLLGPLWIRVWWPRVTLFYNSHPNTLSSCAIRTR